MNKKAIKEIIPEYEIFSMKIIKEENKITRVYKINGTLDYKENKNYYILIIKTQNENNKNTI